MTAAPRGWWVIALGAVALAGACRAAGPAPAARAVAPLPPSDDALAARLCAGRAGCGVRRRRAVTTAGQLVDVALPGGGADSNVCAGAEYWWVPATGEPRRLTRDCDEQDGADALGHADTSVDGDALAISYLGFLSNDGCDGVRARLHLAPLHIERVTRYQGTMSHNLCQTSDELTADWDGSDFPARWSKVRCGGAGAWDPAGEGASVPRLRGTDVPEGTAVGTCAELVDASRAARWMKDVPVARGVTLRAVVVGQQLLLDVAGAGAAGTVTFAAVVGDTMYGDLGHGEFGCLPDQERRLSISTVPLDSGQTQEHGLALGLKVIAHAGTTWRLRGSLPPAVSRLAVGYRAPDGARLDTALLDASPTVDQVPPLAGPYPFATACVLTAGRLDVRPDNVPGDPVLPLQPAP